MIKFPLSGNKELQELQQLCEQQAERMEQLAGELAALKRQMAKMEARMADMDQLVAKMSALDTIVSTRESLQVADSAIEPASVAISPATQRFYLAAPTPDGCFTDISAVEQTGKSLYVLTVKDGMTGLYSMIANDEAMATAMISISQFVKSACKVIGDTHKPPRRIVTVEEGCVTREGDVWRITRKAVVRFE
ncbi:MAG: hypothetical protein ACI3YX_02580 [Prevotella sp.]